MNYIKNKPIYLQIAQDLVLKILREEIKTASLLPSVRELSLMYSVTPKTIQNVTKYLSDFNILNKKPGVGSVITADLNIVRKLHLTHGHDNTTEYLTSMKALLFSNEEILTLIKRSITEEEK